MALAILMERDFVVVGVKLLKVISTEITVFSVTPCSSADGIRSQ
jgi:hypothetical protein